LSPFHSNRTSQKERRDSSSAPPVLDHAEIISKLNDMEVDDAVAASPTVPAHAFFRTFR
jgi:hypothetical protein